MFNKVILIGRLDRNAEVKTAQSKKDYTVLNLATSESWKGDQDKYETHTEWHRVYAWSNLANFARTLQKGQLISLEGKIKYRAIEETIKGQQVKYTIAEIHASSIRRLSKVEAAETTMTGLLPARAFSEIYPDSRSKCPLDKCLELWAIVENRD